MELIFIICFLAVGVWYIWGQRYWRTRRALDALSSLPDFVPTFYAVGINGVGVAMEATTMKVAFVNQAAHAVVYDHRDIVSVEIFRNTVRFASTNRLSQLISALVGNWLFGSKGFRVGGLTGSTTTTERINVLSLKVHVNDVGEPVKEIVLYRGSAIAIDNPKYQRCASVAEEWQARLRLVPRKPTTKSEETPMSPSPASRLRGKLTSPAKH